MNDYIKRSIDEISDIPYNEIMWDDVYGEYSIIKLMAGKDIDEANKHLLYTASYMDNEIVEKTGRPNGGENDFAALKCVVALNTVYDKLYPEVILRMKKFLLEENYESIYGSENHVFIFRVCRYLAAEFFNGDFPYYKMTNAQVLATDKKYMLDFISFRAKYGIGEFNSQYLGTDLFVCSVLESFAKDNQLKTAARMALDLLAIEALNNTDNGLNAYGAFGRTYPWCITNQHCSSGAILKKQIYEKYRSSVRAECEYILAPFNIDKFISDIFLHRDLPFEVYEQKHLHSMYAWRSDNPDYKHIEKLKKAGCISKYTYCCHGYGIGAINHQDDYPVDETEDYFYAHHQQVEWTLLFPENEKDDATKIYSHHPGKTGEHNYYTGDLRCCCSKSFANKDTVLTFYNIEKEEEYDFTQLFIEPDKLKNYTVDGKYIFFSRNGYNAAVYIDKPFYYEEKEVADCLAKHIISKGRKNAYALKIQKDNDDFEDFKKKTKALPVKFDEEKMSFSFGNITLDENGNYTDGIKNKYPYEYVYSTPWCKAKWGEGVITLNAPDGKYILDFNKFEVTKK